MSITYEKLTVSVTRNPEFVASDCFLNVTECYMLSGDESGLRYSRFGEDASGSFCVDITVRDFVALPADRILSLLDKIASSPAMTDGELMETIKASGVCDVPERKYQSTLSGVGTCYRTYMSTADVVELFAYPQQPAYENVGRVVIVEATANVRPDCSIERLVSAMERRFFIVAPDDVKISSGEAVSGDVVELDYSAQGYNDVRTEFVARGQSSRYADYEAPFLLVKNAADAKVEFRSRTVKVIKTTLLLDFGDGRMFRETIDFVPTSSEYNRLHSGSFHGFKAVKLDTPHTFRIEMHPARMDFTVERASADSDTEKHDEPVATEKAGHSRAKKRRSHWPVALLGILLALGCGWAIVRFLPDIIGPTSEYERADAEEIVAHDSVPDFVASTPVEVVSDSVATDSLKADTTVVAVVAQPSAVESGEAEKADLKYLNENVVWRRADLKSEKYKSFFDLFSKGNIKALAESDYFATPVATNAKAIKVIDLLWQAYSTPVQRSNERQLRKLRDKDAINLNELFDDLARYRDSNPNKSARPKAQ